MSQLYEKLITINDKQVARALANQVRDSDSRHVGGIRSKHTGIPSPSHGGTAGDIACFASAIVSEQSAYYRDDDVLEALELAMDYMLNRQHEDGTISLGGTNFNSPPDTGFVVTGLAQVHQLLSNSNEEYLYPIVSKLRKFLQRTIPALLTGGCHTPNHRWVITAALASLYNVFKDERLVRRADEWLAEGMDCTEDGEWTERSNGIYNTVSDIMLFYTAHYLSRPDLLDYVRKNLHMMLYMVHYDGEVVTDYSGRQDYGVHHDLSEYFLSYMLMADYDQDPMFASMFDVIAKTLSRMGPVNNHALLGYLVFPTDLGDVVRGELPDVYTKVFNEHHPVANHLQLMTAVGHHGIIEHSSMHTSFGAPLIRYRDKRTSATVMTRSPSFFSLRHGGVKLLGMSLASMFMPGIVEMEQLQVTESGYHLDAVMSKGYKGPVPQELLSPSMSKQMSPWYLLPHHQRPDTHVQQHRLAVAITQKEREWHVHIQSDEREDVLTQLTLMFAMDGNITGSGLKSDGLTHFWQEGTLRFTCDDDWIELSTGHYEHTLHTVRDGISQANVHLVKVNLLTPFTKTFRIQLSE